MKILILLIWLLGVSNLTQAQGIDCDLFECNCVGVTFKKEGAPVRKNVVMPWGKFAKINRNVDDHKGVHVLYSWNSFGFQICCNEKSNQNSSDPWDLVGFKYIAGDGGDRDVLRIGTLKSSPERLQVQRLTTGDDVNDKVFGPLIDKTGNLSTAFFPKGSEPIEMTNNQTVITNAAADRALMRADIVDGC